MRRYQPLGCVGSLGFWGVGVTYCRMYCTGTPARPRVKGSTTTVKGGEAMHSKTDTGVQSD